MNKFEDICGVVFDFDGMLVDSVFGFVVVVDMVLYVLELFVVGEECVIIWIGNGVDVLMECVLIWVCQECVIQCKIMGKLFVDDDILVEEQVCILCKLFDCYYGEVVEEGMFLFLYVVDMLGVLQVKGLLLGLVINKLMLFVVLLFEVLDIVKYFSVVIGGDDV